MRGKSEFGISNYHLPRCAVEDVPKTARIHPGKKTTFIDEAVKLKTFVPESSRYNVIKEMGSNTKADMAKGKRKLMTDDIANFQRLNPFPAPNHFKPDYTPT